jgi:hypothetical protein
VYLPDSPQLVDTGRHDLGHVLPHAEFRVEHDAKVPKHVPWLDDTEPTVTVQTLITIPISIHHLSMIVSNMVMHWLPEESKPEFAG